MVILNEIFFEAIRQINPLKAIGPDGISDIQKGLKIIGISVCNMVPLLYYGH